MPSPSPEGSRGIILSILALFVLVFVLSLLFVVKSKSILLFSSSSSASSMVISFDIVEMEVEETVVDDIAVGEIEVVETEVEEIEVVEEGEVEEEEEEDGEEREVEEGEEEELEEERKEGRETSREVRKSCSWVFRAFILFSCSSFILSISTFFFVFPFLCWLIAPGAGKYKEKREKSDEKREENAHHLQTTDLELLSPLNYNYLILLSSF